MLLDLLLPQRCLACGCRADGICARCHAALPRLAPPLCACCGAPVAWPVERCRECSGRRLGFARARAAVAYDRAVRALVAGWKERGLRRLSALAADLVAETVPRPEADALAWVPPDAGRQLRRGHSTAAALARELAARWELEALPLLARTRPVAPQRGLALAERRRNVRGAFRAEPAPRAVCLVDDVYTTGATASAAATALRAAGARRVEVVAFARTLRSLPSR